MKTHRAGIIFLTVCVACAALAAGPATNAPAALDVAAIRAGAEANVRKNVQQFVRAFNAHDPEAVAAEWSLHGTYTGQDGMVYRGREAIARLYKDFFAEYPEAQIEVNIEEIRLVNAFTVLERGATTLTYAPDSVQSSSRYIATHVRRGDTWTMVSVEELPDATAEKFAVLDDLAWLVGTWRATNGTLITEMIIARVGDGPFFHRTWTVCEGTNVLLHGVQVIGWDPALEQVASWTFDSRGNTDKGLWSAERNGWAIEAEGMLVDGTPFSAMYLMTQSGPNALTVRSMNRFAGGVALPEIADVTITRVTQ